jgi:DNA invertase Pin-like site-specific DNA recombinase
MGRKLDGYVRVSRRAGREGEAFISPAVQRQKIEAWAQVAGVEVIRWWEEIDQSGATVDRPMFHEIRKRIAAGETEGLVVADRSRFARSLHDALAVIREMDRVGATFASADGFDSSTPEGRLGVHIMLSFAQYHLETIRSNWASATARAVADGVHISATPPTGYLRDGKRARLRVDPAVGPLIPEVFSQRAEGASVKALVDFLAEHGIKISRTGVQGILANPAYLGEARGPNGVTNPDAHPPLITVEQYEAAQAMRGPKAVRLGGWSSKTVLGGLIRCAGCGHRLRVMAPARRKGDRVPTYACVNLHCTARSAAYAHIVDEHVEGLIQDAALASNPYVAAVLNDDDRYLRAQQAVADARTEMTAFVTTTSALDADLFEAGRVARQERLNLARTELAALPPDMQVPKRALTFEQANLDARRLTGRRLLAAVTLRSAGHRAGVPVAERVAIRWVGQPS